MHDMSCFNLSSTDSPRSNGRCWQNDAKHNYGQTVHSLAIPVHSLRDPGKNLSKKAVASHILNLILIHGQDAIGGVRLPEDPCIAPFPEISARLAEFRVSSHNQNLGSNPTGGSRSEWQGSQLPNMYFRQLSVRLPSR